MILPRTRASFGRAEAGVALRILGEGSAESRARLESRLANEGFDALLDDPRMLNAVLAGPGPAVPAPLVYYVLVRHALLEIGVTDRVLADYVASLLHDFGTRDRALRVDDNTGPRYEYLVDLVAAIDAARGRREFLLQAHLGNYALWVSGLFPDRIVARVHRRGAPGIEYYEELGASAFRVAAETADAKRYGVGEVLSSCADAFAKLRVGLNRVSDRHLFPRRGDTVDRLLRQIVDARLIQESKE